MASIRAWNEVASAHGNHPDFGHLVLLVFEAVLEVVFVSLPGYIVARQGLFDAEAQKFVANLNVMVFTPCLVFTKLASQLTLDKMADLVVIPFIFAAQTLISYFCSLLVSKAFGFQKRPRNFIVAMGVFGNSNSLPISLVVSLANTISGLHWDEIPHDNDDDVAARGILYLLIFQQLGQLVRWTWGYNVLLKPSKFYTIEEGGSNREIEDCYRDDPEEEENDESQVNHRSVPQESNTAHTSGTVSPIYNYTDGQYDSTNISVDSDTSSEPPLLTKRLNGAMEPYRDDITVEVNTDVSTNSAPKPLTKRPSLVQRTTQYSQQQVARGKAYWVQKLSPFFHALPVPMQTALAFLWKHFARFCGFVWDFMNPPLWAMLVAMLVATVPDLQRLFFKKGTFINNSITSAVSQSAGVAVPLILVVLGANLARNTVSDDEEEFPRTPEAKRFERKLVVASILSRMVLPFLIMAPMLALTAKFVPVSILDDPIFIIVCFLLTGAPSALQLAQICQINNVYMGAMSSLLFQSYVVWLLPSTLVLVTSALEVVEWAQATN